MRRVHSLLSLACALALTGCPNEIGGGDGGPSDGGGGNGADGGQQDGGGDAGTPAPDAGDPTDGGGPTDAGDTDAGPTDGGLSCPIADPCAGTSAVSPVQLDVSGASPALVVGGTTLSLGTATRGQVEAALGGAGLAVGDNVFRAYHCAHRVVLHYVDDLDNNGEFFQGVASAGDVLSRVVTLPLADVTASNGVVQGGARATERAKLTGASSYDLTAGGYDVSAADGMALVSDASGTVANLTLFKPQAADLWGLSVDVANARIGSGNTALGKNDTFAEADAALGTAYDQQGMTEVNFLADAQVRIYGAFGVRIAGVCTSNTPCSPQTTIQSIVLSPPFLGETADGLGLGASQAEIEAVYGQGSPSPDNADLLVYELGNNDLGVVYIEDEACVRRAAALVLAYRAP